MFRTNNSMEYDDIRHKKKCDEEHYNEKQDKRDHNDDDRHKRKQDEKQHKREHNDERCKRKQDKKQHKKDHNDERHKRKQDEEQHKKGHNDDRHKRNNNEEHHKKDHNSELHKRKHHEKHHDEVDQKKENDKNYFIERDLLNFFKTFIAENNNYVPLENNVGDKNLDILKEDDIEKSVKDENCNLPKEDDIENDVEDENCNLSKEDDLENNVEDKNLDLSKADLENNVEDENCNLSKEDSLENKNYTCFEDLYNEDLLEENHNTIPIEEFSKDTLNNQVDEVKIVNFKTMVTSEILPLCENIIHTSEVAVEPVTVKIPVVLTECTLTITVESSLKLEDVVLEIKHIRKNVYLNQCELIPSSEDGKPNTGILFVDGFIRKNIEYTTKDHNDNGVSCGKVKHATVKVPFKCTTRVTFKTYPKFKPNNYQDEVKTLQTSIKVFHPCEEDIIGGDTREQSFKIIEYFNEKVSCELISAEIIESDILENPINKEYKIPLEQGFHNITEKVVLSLTIKLLQNQHVDISNKN
ncbi:CsxC family protein [Clostridium sp. FP1]|uniref:CsxC family protein n=1 Tax=Clostridium sp. FP1 TaxID=2724076 RepID=UPI0013E98A11|nr:hypothetical protein [Clostridium sp. FP1]MBZ9633921.1 hypothetical protein [Clostridium sp. FP1]